MTINQGVDHARPARPAADTESLSAQQRRLWVLNQLERTDAAHNVPASVEIQGRLDVAALEKAVRAVCQRHEILRSRFVLENNEPRPVILSSGLRLLPVIDLAYLSQPKRRREALARAAEELQEAFDLQTGPPLRAVLYRLSDDQHLLAISLHQIVCDSISSLLLAKEIANSYDCIVRHIPPASPDLQYVDYVRSQDEYLRGDEFACDLDHWRNKLEGAPAALELPTDHPRPLVPSFHGATQCTTISGDFLAEIRSLSRSEQSSTFLVLLSAFVCLLARYTAGEDIVIGTEVSGRRAHGLASVLGALSNQLVLRADCSGNPSFRDMLSRVSQIWDEAERHQRLPFGSLLDALRVPRDMNRNPLFQVSFSYGAGSEAILAAGLRWEPVRFDTEIEVLDLSFDVTERDREIELRFSYSTDLFESATIARMVGHYHTLLQSAIENSGQTISQLPLLTAAEELQILVDWNDTAVDYTRDLPLNKLIENQVELTPDALSLVYKSEHVTYRQLNDRANQLAHYLRRLGVGPDVLVGVCAERSVEMVVALLGVLKAGGAYVPLDAEYPRARLEAMIEDAAPPVVLTQVGLLDRLPVAANRIFCLDRDWPCLDNESTENPEIIVTGKNVAYTIYTSGSTGKPKGVPNVHEGIVNQVLWMRDSYPLNTSDRVMQKTPYSFDVSVWEVFWPLITGACLVIAEPGGHKDPAYLIKLITEQKITTIHFVPSMLSIFLEAEGVERCRTVQRVFLSGEAVPFELQQRFFERLNVELHNIYGPTEAAVHVTYWACRPGSKQSIVPIGRPVANTQIYILDRNLQPVPVGIAGELHIGGRQLASGYLNRPDLTAEKFIRDPFAKDPQARLYKTGDLARFLSDGNIEYLGRIDHQVKLRGFRIELGEIEAVLADHAAIRQAVVTVREDALGDKRLAAYLVLTPGCELNLESLQSYLTSKLPDFMVPSKFVVLDGFPMTTSGKVDRKALPAPETESRGTELILPRNEMESLLASLFESILNVDSVSIRDDFFDLGGHSLMAARLVSQIRAVTGKRIPLAALFRAPTVELLAGIIEDESELGNDPVVMEIQRGNGRRLPFFAIVPPGEESLGYAILARHMGPEQTVYKVQGHAPVTYGKRPYSDQEIQALTDECLAAMRTVQPQGPYCLGGLCDGTHIAEQIVLSLEAQGEEVGLFAIFDTWVLQHSQRRWLWKVHYFGLRWQEIRGLNPIERLAAYKRAAKDRIQTLAGKKPPRTDWQQAYWPENFTPKRFRAPVLLFKRPKQPFYYVKDPQMGWGARTETGVEIHEVDFSHLEILREPQVGIFGEELAEYIADIKIRPANLQVTGTSSESSRLTASIQRVQSGS